MRWPGVEDLALGALWLHIGGYLGYSLLIKDKDSRIVYPMGILILGVMVNLFGFNVSSEVQSISFFLLFLGYIGFHLLIKDFLGENDMLIFRKLSMGALGLFAIAGLFKMLELPYSDVALIVGCSSMALMLLLVGLTKDLVRKK
ncbi:MAG: hypothetical protein COA58_14355 [Bacteroidetes bacterium]|nr:MAG: hypothetical protein COA58_14355 [Bacteroidota bacterium]